MPKQTKVCRVCGKSYEACQNARSGNNIFNWREMCCSPECGTAYFQQVEAARSDTPRKKTQKTKTPDKIVSDNTGPTESNPESGVQSFE